MTAFFKRLPSRAMIVACVSLVLALGGVSYAAGVLPANSVGAKQLRTTDEQGTTNFDGIGVSSK